MFVIFDNSIAIKAFENQQDAINYWRKHGGTIVLYPDLKREEILV